MISKLYVFKRYMISQHIFAAFVAIAIIAGVAIVRDDPIELLAVEVTDKVKPGSKIGELVEVHRKRNDCTSVVHAEIIDGQNIVFKIKPEDLPPAVNRGPTFIYREYPVPFAAAWGHSQLVVQRTYFCWPFYTWWPIVRPVRKLPFDIVPP